MTAAEIGRAILPTLAKRLSVSTNGFVPRDFARSSAETRANGSPRYEQLILEGLGFLDRAGMLVGKPGNIDGNWFILSRAGAEIAAQTEADVPAAAAGQEARTLLHPRIANAALGHLERGGTFLDDAATAAFREVEERVRRAAKLGPAVSGKQVFYDAFKDKPKCALVPTDMIPAEVLALREVLAGAYGFFRNPSAHRHVQDDAAQTMRVLLLASTLMYVLDEMEAQHVSQL